MNTCVPTQPFGFNFLGGKFFMVSTKLVEEWNKKYKTTLVGITTTSLFGSKSQYQSFEVLETSGNIIWENTYQTTRGRMVVLRQWLKDYYPDIHEKVMSESSPKQKPFKKCFKNTEYQIYRLLSVHKRGVSFLLVPKL